MPKYANDGSANVTVVGGTGGPGSAVGTPEYTQLVNGSLAAITAAAVTTTQTSADIPNPNARGVKVVLDMTAVGTGSVTIKINVKDVASGKYITLLTGAAVVTNSTNTYTVYPGLTPAANVTVSDVVTAVVQIVVTANNANATTYTVGVNFLF